MKAFAVLTPYIIPASLKKTVNLGDGFILRAVERHIGPFDRDQTFSSRERPSAAAMSRLCDARAVILAGANQLDDRFSVWPGATARELDASGLRFVPFGIGLHGEEERNQGFTANTLEIIESIHKKIEYSSWRCQRTVDLLDAALPHLRGRFLMTGCPVLYDAPLIEGKEFLERSRSVAVTITDRGNFTERETALLETVAAEFPRARRYLVLHQNFRPMSRIERYFGHLPLAKYYQKDNKFVQLRVRARQLGYKIVAPGSADALIRFYADVDMHIGSRLHAHLLFLSRNKRSFLLAVDGRSQGFAEGLGFPIVEGPDLANHLNFDFEIVRNRARQSFQTMKTFVESLDRI